MARFRIEDLKSLERAPTSPGSLTNKIGGLLYASIHCIAKVEGVNPETGEYRIVLQGTLDKDDARFEEF